MAEYPTSIRYRTLAWLTAAAMLAYLCRNAIGVAESTIREDLDLTLTQSGIFMGAFFWTYALFQIPTGWFAQSFGTRLALTVFAMAWSIVTCGTAVAPVFWILIVTQLLMGIAQSGIFPAACNSIGHWMPFSERSLACGILAAGMQIGAIMASGLTGGLTATIGWRWVFAVFALPGVLWTVFFYLQFRNHPDQVEAVNGEELKLIGEGRANQDSAKEPASVAQKPIDEAESDWMELLLRPTIWFLCGQQICRAAGSMFFASWFPTFLQKTRGVSIEGSGYLQALVFIGTFAGCILGGMITDWIWRVTGNVRISRSGVGAAALGSCAILILAAWFVQSVVFAVILLALGALCAAFAGPCAFAATIDIGGRRVPQVFGLMNMCGNLAAAACPFLVAILFERTANWDLVLLLFAGVYLTGAICWALVDTRD